MSAGKWVGLVVGATVLIAFFWAYNDRQASKGVEKEHADSAWIRSERYRQNERLFGPMKRSVSEQNLFGPPAPARRSNRHQPQ